MISLVTLFRNSRGKICSHWYSYTFSTNGEAFVHYHTDSNNQYREEGFRVTYRSIGQWNIDSQLVFMYFVTMHAPVYHWNGPCDNGNTTSCY